MLSSTDQNMHLQKLRELFSGKKCRVLRRRGSNYAHTYLYFAILIHTIIGFTCFGVCTPKGSCCGVLQTILVLKKFWLCVRMFQCTTISLFFMKHVPLLILHQQKLPRSLSCTESRECRRAAFLPPPLEYERWPYGVIFAKFLFLTRAF